MKHILLFHFFTTAFLTFAQNIPIGQWRVHSPYNSSISIAVSQNQVYSSSGIGVFYINKEDNSINTLSKITGLSDINVSQVKTDPTSNITVLAYANGNIDILKNGSVNNESDILNSSILGSKTPSDIHFFNGYAYMCYPFGISVLNPVKNEIKESYINLAPNNTVNPVFSCATTSHTGSIPDSIYAATQNGLIGAVISSTVNLMDFANWYAFDSTNGLRDTAKFVAVQNYNGHMYALSKNKLYVYTGSVWDTLSLPVKLKGRGRNLESSNGLLVIAAGNKIITFNGSAFTTLIDPSIYNTVDAVYDNQGVLWMADSSNGLLSKVGNYGITWNVPSGPFTASIFKLSEHNGTVIGVPGGYDINEAYGSPNGIPGGYYSFYNGVWTNFDIGNGFPGNVYHIVQSDYNPVSNNLYLASLSQGMIEVSPTGKYVQYNSTNSPLIDVCNPISVCDFVIDVAHDSKGNEWVLNEFSSKAFILQADGKWDSTSLFGSASQYPVLLLIDDNDNAWISFRVGGGAPLMIYNSNRKLSVTLQSGKGLGNLPDLNIYSMAEDQNGAVWIGTDNGIVIYEDPSQFFNSNKAYIVDATVPIYNGYPLMFQQQVNAIAVDGGNRKWVATPNGAWLFNEDGTQPLLNFTISNSPLLSNNVLDITVNSVTGEVFFATDQGLISYRGTATEATNTYSKVKVFPNPVPHSYDGTIGISGLAENADVKITDIYGNLVYETHASGGTAVWNGRNYNGRAADSGVYLIFSSLDDGSVSLVSKFAVIE